MRLRIECILANNSQIDLKGLVDVYGNAKGIDLDTSKLTYQNLCVEDHNSTGLRARNSIILFDSVANPLAGGQEARYQVDFARNGQHVDLQKQSEFIFSRKNHIYHYYLLKNTCLTKTNSVSSLISPYV